MVDREKVMQWLETCANGCEDGCPYEYKNLVYRVECKADLMSDALELLREQETVARCKDCKYWHDPIRCQMYSEGMLTDGNWFCADGEKR